MKALIQGVFYLGISILMVSRTVSGNISHDENQFIAPGQFLAYDGLLPYVDYPYTHMPYAIPFYALSALASDFDLLAGRILSSLFWLGCIVLMVGIGRRLTRGSEGESREPSWWRLAWEFCLVFALVQDATAQFVLRAALNHAQATFFSLLATLFFVRGTQDAERSRRWAFLSGACIAVAGLTRFNYASLLVVLCAAWLIRSLQVGRHQWMRLMLAYAGGALAASLPALALAALAPGQFYYGNLVYIRLNAVYYEMLLHRSGMDMADKLGGFVSVLRDQPLELVLYGVLLYTVIRAAIQARRSKAPPDIARLTIAAVAAALWTTAFAPTPALLHYLAAPLPFLFILLLSFEIRLPRYATGARALGALAVATAAVIGMWRSNPLGEVSTLAQPELWPPVQVHDLALSIRELVPRGKVLGLQSMVPLEAGLDAYPFTATGPFSWRTSLLLTPDRRREYKVTSPEELAALLDNAPPDAVLVGFEAPNPGFERKDMGGLELPFSEYAAANGYTLHRLETPFWSRGLMLWVRP